MEYANDKVEQNQVKSKTQWFKLLIISTAYIAVAANIQGFKALLPLVTDEFGISRAQAGLYSSFYFLSATLVAVYSGRIVDSLGARKGLIIGVTAMGLLIILHSFAPFFGFILFLAFLTGLGFSIITPSVNKAVLVLVDPNRRAFSMGITHAGGGLGGFLGASVLPLLGVMVGWRTALLYAGIFAIFIGLIVIGRFFHNAPRQQQDPKSPTQRSSSLKEDLLMLLQNRYLLCVCLMGLVFGMSLSSITTHFTLYLNQDIGFSPEIAGVSLGAFMIAGIISQPVWGQISDSVLKGDRRKTLLLQSLLVVITVMIFGIFVGRAINSFSVILALSSLLGFFIIGMQGLFFTTVIELATSEHTGVITGIGLVFTRTGMVLTPPLFGLVADITGTYSLSFILLGSAVFCLALVFNYLSARHRPQKSGSQGNTVK